MYLLDLITRAGGLSGGASGTGILYRRGIPRPSVTAKLMVDGAATDAAAFEAAPSEPVPSEPVPSAPAPSEPVPSAPAPSEPVPSEPAAGELPAEAQVIKVNLDELREGKRPDLNIPLQGGDVLYIPRRQGRTIYIIGDVKIPGAYNLPRRGTVSAAQALVYAGGPMLTAKNSAGFLMRHKANGERQAIPIDFIDIIKGRKPDIPVQADDIIFIPNSAAKTIGVNLLNQIPRLLQQLVIF
jgi:protein involved in polysaccharide export with SLBB domain